MFERIISINNNYAIVKISNNFNNDILNYNVIFDDSSKRILGEINEVINFEAKISFLGEFIDNRFFSGVIRKPSTNCMIRIINQQENITMSLHPITTVPIHISAVAVSQTV